MIPLLTIDNIDNFVVVKEIVSCITVTMAALNTASCMLLHTVWALDTV